MIYLCSTVITQALALTWSSQNNHEFMGAVFLSLDKTPPFLITQCFFPPHIPITNVWISDTDQLNDLVQPYLYSSLCWLTVLSVLILHRHQSLISQVMLTRKRIPGNKRILNTEMVQILGLTSCQGGDRLSLGWRLSHKWNPALWNGKPSRENRTHVPAWVCKWWYPFCSHTCTSHFPPTCLDIPLSLSVSCRSLGKCANI